MKLQRCVTVIFSAVGPPPLGCEILTGYLVEISAVCISTLCLFLLSASSDPHKCLQKFIKTEILSPYYKLRRSKSYINEIVKILNRLIQAYDVFYFLDTH